MVQQFNQFFELITSNPLNAIFLILGILLLEVILSFDNAAVLATMVKDLPKEQKAAFLSSMNSYLGIMKHYKSYKLRKRMVFKRLSGIGLTTHI